MTKEQLRSRIRDLEAALEEKQRELDRMTAARSARHTAGRDPAATPESRPDDEAPGRTY